MGDVLVKGGTVRGGRIEKLHVHIHKVPERTIDRETAIAWMRDGHSLIPFVNGRRGPALQLVAVGEDEEPFVRADTDRVAEDSLPELPPA